MSDRRCHDCGVEPGELHIRGCDNERCPFCGMQLISCDCVYIKLGPEFGFEFKPEILVRAWNPFRPPEGYKLEYMIGRHTMVFRYPNAGLPEDVYGEGPTPEMAERHDELLDEIGRIPWTGEHPAAAACRRFGLWSKMVPGKGWVTCDKDDPEATEDLNTLLARFLWDPEVKDWKVPDDVEEEYAGQ